MDLPGEEAAKRGMHQPEVVVAAVRIPFEGAEVVHKGAEAQ